MDHGPRLAVVSTKSSGSWLYYDIGIQYHELSNNNIDELPAYCLFEQLWSSPKVPMPIMESSAAEAVTESLKQGIFRLFCRNPHVMVISLHQTRPRCWANDKIVMLIVQSSAVPSGGRGNLIRLRSMQAGCCKAVFFL